MASFWLVDRIAMVARVSGVRGFAPGNELAIGKGRPETHGAYQPSIVKLGPVIEERSTEIRAVLPAYAPCDEVAVRALAGIMFSLRIERAEAALEQLEEEADSAGGTRWRCTGRRTTCTGVLSGVEGLRESLRKWLGTAERYLSALGMTPASRARLGLDLARSQRLTLLDLHRDEGVPLALEEADA